MKKINEPVAVAYSGGVDSTAALHMAVAKYIDVTALIVDHNLRTESGEEAKWCKSNAEAIGAKAVVLTWEHDGVDTDIQKKARNARYSLMGEYCRSNNIKTIIVGHHKDDVYTSLFMKNSRLIREKVYAPVWPELKNIFLVRPMLGLSKNQIVDYCLQNDLEWVEDPSNKSDKYERNRVNRDRPNQDIFDIIYNQNKVGYSQLKSYSELFLNKTQVSDDKVFIHQPEENWYSHYFATMLSSAIMCATDRKKEPRLNSVKETIKFVAKTGKNATIGDCLISNEDTKMVLYIQKAKRGQVRKQLSPDFMDRLSKRYL